MEKMAINTANKFQSKNISNMLLKENEGEDIELEINLLLKIKTPLGAKVFKYETEKIDVGNVEPKVIKPDKKVMHQVNTVKERLLKKINEPQPRQEKDIAQVNFLDDQATPQPPPAVLLTPVNKQRAPYDRSSAGNRSKKVRRIDFLDDEDDESDVEETSDNRIKTPIKLLPAKRKSKMGPQDPGPSGNSGVRDGGHGGSG